MFNRHPFLMQHRREGPFRRGVIKYIILQYLKDKPSYGYEIIRALEERFHGLYTPSAGSIYPTLQMLEEMGYLTSVERDSKRVYTITNEGRDFLSEDTELEQAVRDRLKNWVNPENTEDRGKTINEFRQLAELLREEVRKMDSEKLGRAREVLSRAYKDIENILKS